MRRSVTALITAVLVVVGLGIAAFATGGDSTITRARIERSLPQTFSNLYAQQATLLGHQGVTPDSLQATAMCDKHGPDVTDVGPGGDWICLMSWKDPNVPMPPEGYGKFELNVHSNGCYTASGSTKLTGYLMITDKRGREVTNPVFEFDGCFDPSSDDTPTGNSFPSLVSITSTSVTPDQQGRASVQLGCGTGADGCAGTVVAKAGATVLGTQSFDMKEESTKILTFPTPLPAGTKEVAYTVTPSTGVGPSSPSTLPVQNGQS
ncbi:hypothetical protein [Nocardioides sp. MH1]|uniref:hypothetical protein n=1 Tax=Nocardioides sp. MH1 TaxID=3242490 RepID=UPI003521A645